MGRGIQTAMGANTMTSTDARELLEAAAKTHTGRRILRDMGYGMVIDRPRDGDDDSSIAIATMLQDELVRRFTSHLY